MGYRAFSYADLDLHLVVLLLRDPDHGPQPEALDALVCRRTESRFPERPVNPRAAFLCSRRKEEVMPESLVSPFIRQDWAAYTDQQHAVWQTLYARRMPALRSTALR